MRLIAGTIPPPRAGLYNRRVRALSLALAACVACSSAGDENAPVDAGAPRVELGSGARAWQPLPLDGSGACELVHGPQGGYHIFGRVRYSGLPGDVYLAFRVVAIDGGEVFTDDVRLRRLLGRGLVQTATGYESATSELVILRIVVPAQVVGRKVRFEVRVTDAAGAAMAGDAREVTVVDEEP